jgi:hypothetical protein
VMPMFLHVSSARYLDDYRVEVQFNDGKKGVADLAGALDGPAFEPLKDQSVFAQLRVDEDLDTVVWPNGADFAPEFLYFLAFKNIPELQARFKTWGYIA